MTTLMIDVGGTNVKFMISAEGEMRKVPSGPEMSAKDMVNAVIAHTQDWNYDRVSIGFPGLVKHGKPVRDPLNLGGGWISFNYATAFGKPVRFINDASMQALGNYRTGRMLFLGLGTSTGTTLIADDVVIPIEIGLVRLSRKVCLMDRLSKAALGELGKKEWMDAVHEAVDLLMDVFGPDVLVLGGGNAKHVDPLPDNCRPTDNRSAYLGACRLWEDADLYAAPHATTWQIRRNNHATPLAVLLEEEKS
jgi:polyphosphate glucokinase